MQEIKTRTTHVVVDKDKVIVKTNKKLYIDCCKDVYVKHKRRYRRCEIITPSHPPLFQITSDQTVPVLLVPVKTVEVEYPCVCGTYNKPFMYYADGSALCVCKSCGKQYKTSIPVSVNFRKLCQRLGSKPNRSPTYYTSTEREVKKYLEKCGYREGLDFWHNVRVKLDGRYYWLDFYIPKENRVISVSPKIWHSRWGREKSDKEFNRRIKAIGLKHIVVDEKNYKKILQDHLEWVVV